MIIGQPFLISNLENKMKKVKQVEESNSVFPEQKIKFFFKEKGTKLYKEEYESFYLYLTGGRAELYLENDKMIFVEAAPVWKNEQNIFQINDNIEYLYCKSDCQFAMIKKYLVR